MTRRRWSTVVVLGALAGALTGAVAGEPGAAMPASPPFLLQNRLRQPEPSRATPLRVNPPTFRWPASPGATGYRIELSRDPDFRSVQTAIESDPFHRPLAPLEAGVWHWRVRAERPTVGAWLGEQSFALADALPRWPLPSWDELLQRIPAPRPRTYARAEQFAAWRGDSGLAAQLAPRAAKIRAALERPFALEEYVARTKLPGDSTAQVAKRVEWESKGAARDASQPAADAAWLWRATGDGSFRDAAKARSLAAAALDPAGFTSDATTDFGNAAIVENLGICYDLLYDEFSPEERARLRAAIVARARPIFAKMRLASQDLMRPHNWQHVFLEGLVGALALHGEEPVADDWLRLGLKSFVAFYPWFGGADGGSHEGPRYYHATEMLSSLDTLDFFRAAFGVRLEDGNPWFRGNAAFLMYSFPPGSRMAELADNNLGVVDEGDDRSAPGDRARLAARRMAGLYDDPFAAAYAAAIAPARDIELTLSEELRWRAAPTVAPRPLAELPSARLFRDMGAVFTHSAYTRPEDNVRLVFHSSPYGGFGHGHADQNSFHVIAYDEPLLLDAGYYTPAGDPHRQKYSVQTKAHNTILVDGTGQPYGDSSGYGQVTDFEDNDDWTRFTGRAAAAYREAPLARFDRHVVWLKRTAVPTYVIVDELAARDAAPHRFDWLLHAANRMTIEEAERKVTVTGAKGEARITFIEPAALALHQDDQFDVPAVYWRNGKNYPLPNQWHLRATPPAAPQARFVTVVQVAKRGTPLPPLRALEAGAEIGGWRVQFSAATHQLHVEKMP
jgi:hypothetical protein